MSKLEDRCIFCEFWDVENCFICFYDRGFCMYQAGPLPAWLLIKYPHILVYWSVPFIQCSCCHNYKGDKVLVLCNHLISELPLLLKYEMYFTWKGLTFVTERLLSCRNTQSQQVDHVHGTKTLKLKPRSVGHLRVYIEDVGYASKISRALVQNVGPSLVST